MSDLRPYQEECVKNIHHELQNGSRSTLFVMPTGTGKTETALSAINQWPDKDCGVLSISHREELVWQPWERWQRLYGQTCEVEMGEYKRSHHGHRVTFSSKDSLHPPRLRDAFPDPKSVGLIWVDEAHHLAKKNKSYQHIIDYFMEANPDCRLMGCTATPDRTDEAALGEVLDSVAFDFPLFDPDGGESAIGDGWLVGIDQYYVNVEELTFNTVGSRGGDFIDSQLEQMMLQDRAMYKIAVETNKRTQGRSTMTFVPGIKSAIVTAQIYNAEIDESAYCLVSRIPQEYADYQHVINSGDKEQRRNIIRRFSRSDFQHLVNVGVLTEGFDAPIVEAIAMGRPTKSRSFYAQCLDSQTEILTSKGWTGIDDRWTPDTCVAAYDIGTETIQWQSAIRMERMLGHSEGMFGIAGPQIDLRVTAGHRMVASQRVGRKHARTAWAFVEASDPPSEFFVPVCGHQPAGGIPLTDDEIRFVGLFMTDGNVNYRNGAITLYQSERYPFAISYIERVLDRCGVKFGRPQPETAPTNYGERRFPLHRWTISYGKPRGRDAHKRGWSHLEKYIDKNLSSAFESITRDQLLVLLEAMEIGDGNKHEPDDYQRRTRVVCTSNRTMADRVQSLCVRRGVRCSVKQVTEAAWRIHYRLDKTDHVILTSASDTRPVWTQVERDTEERVWCVEVPFGAIVTRRRGTVTIVGNCVGRGTRVLPDVIEGPGWRLESREERLEAIANSLKPTLTILDFVGNSRHPLISSLDILGGRYDDEVVERAKKKAKKDGKGHSRDLLEEAQRELLHEQELERRRQLKAQTKSSARKIDPFTVLNVVPGREPGWHKGRKPTEGQKQALRNCKLPERDIEKMTYWQASKTLDKISQRIEKGLCTYKQANLLTKYGESPDCTFEEASAKIDRIAKNGWTPLSD